MSRNVVRARSSSKNKIASYFRKYSRFGTLNLVKRRTLNANLCVTISIAEMVPKLQ